MSIKDPPKVSISINKKIAESVESFTQEISAQLALDPTRPYLANLAPAQLAILANGWATQPHRQVIIFDKNNDHVEELAGLLEAWSQQLTNGKNWALINDALSEQERQGDVYTKLSEAFHTALFYNDQSHNLIIPAEALAAGPDPQAYQAAIIKLTVGEKLELTNLAHRLVEAGYIRHRASLPDGSFRIRGEAIDIRHPLLPGQYTIITYGRLIERIIHQIDQRSTSLTSLRLPPMNFPIVDVGWDQMFNEDTLYYPEHSLHSSGRERIIYNSANSLNAFPLSQSEEPPTSEQHIYIMYKNKDRVLSQIRQRFSSQKVFLYKSILSDFPLRLGSDAWRLFTEKDLLPEAVESFSPLALDQAAELINQLKVGSPAVHADHGIGIYDGLQTRILAGFPREYLVLRYAAGDSLSVPVEFAHKVTAYTGQDSPPIYRLSSAAAWQKTKKKAQVNAAAFAKELIEINKKRYGAIRPSYSIDPAREQELNDSFPYELTTDQIQAWEDVQKDLSTPHPMDRLIVGDVGFGKTEIAIRAAYHAAFNNKQVAIIAPTTLLVQQHFDTFKQRLPQLAANTYVLSRFVSNKDKAVARSAMNDGQAKIVVGTQALLHKLSAWQDLGLVIIDEEQKFGVKQKEHFKKIRASVDVLSLSATPIPRTLSMSLSGLKSLSLINTAPEKRKSIKTHVGRLTPSILEQAITRELKRTGQVYVVAPRIRNLASIHAQLKQLFPTARLAVAHGQLPDQKLGEIIHQFDEGTIDILVSSSIVENGLDLPNVNTIVAWHAPHFGLAELYQLRGRVGRRDRQGYAYFLYNQDRLTDIQRQRLTVITESSRLGSGWNVARRDLEMRGGGNLLGREQSGAIDSVGIGLYLDLVQQAVDSDQALVDTDIQLPLITVLPTHYISDPEDRARWYTLLSRSRSSAKLQEQQKRMEKSFGPLPLEAKNLIDIIDLQIIARKLSIEKIHYQTISPSDKDPYYRLIINTNDPVTTLSHVNNMGRWVARDTSLALDVNKIDAPLIEKLTANLRAAVK